LPPLPVMSNTDHLYSRFFHWVERSAMTRWQNDVAGNPIIRLKRLKLMDQVSQNNTLSSTLSSLFNLEGYLLFGSKQNFGV